MTDMDVAAGNSEGILTDPSSALNPHPKAELHLIAPLLVLAVSLTQAAAPSHAPDAAELPLWLGMG